MSTLVTRAGKGSPLTHNEVDTNFTNLNTDKVEKTSAAITGGTIDNTTIGATTPNTGVFTTLTGNSTSQFGRSSANYLQAVGAASSSSPIFSVAGSDTNIDLNLTTKGTGNVVANVNSGTFTIGRDSASNALKLTAPNQNLYVQSTGGGAILFNTADGTLNQMRIISTASAVNYVQVTGAATGAGPIISAQGSDTNINTTVSAKGFSSFINFTAAGTTDYRAFSVSTSGASNTGNYLQAKGNASGTGPVLSSVGSDTNIPLVLQPKGTGALQAQQTDSTATGGNARGANAVDWQTLRSAANRVASGSFSVIGGGYDNTSGFACGVASGYSNSAIGSYTGVGGGKNNIAGGGDFSSIVGGQSNTGAGFFNFVGAGQSNSGTSSSAVTTQSATMNGTTAVTLSGSNASIKVGQLITGTSIASYTYVAAISGTSLTLSQAASGSSTSTLSFYTPHGVVVGGGNNQATGSYSFIGGGGDAGTAANRNVASGDWSFVGGGSKNVASGLGAVVVGGGNGTSTYTNTASGVGSFIGGGYSNNVTVELSSIVGGVSSTASGRNSFVGGGYFHSANAEFSVITGGNLGTARSITGYQIFPAHNNPVGGSQGNSQAALLILGAQTTDATATVLRSSTSAASTTNQVIMPNNSAYFFTGEVVSGVTGGGNTKGWTIEGVIKRGANAASTALVGTPTVTSMYADVGAATWTIAVTADTTNGGLAVTFTGQASTTIRTVAQIRTTEMTY